jgi:hypothetical protein
MKYLSLVCLMFLAGCNLAPVLDESIVLPEPVVIDKVDNVPPQPVPMPAPKQERPPVLEPEQPEQPEPVIVKPEPKREVVQVAKEPVKPAQTRWEHNAHWSYPGSTSDDAWRSKLRAHLAGKPHYLATEGMAAEQVLNLHDALHEAERNGKASAPVKSTVTKTAPVARSTVQQYTINSCGICKSDVRNYFPLWAKQGWTMLPPIDETANPRGRYPRYEIRGADGAYREFVGSLQGYK